MKIDDSTLLLVELGTPPPHAPEEDRPAEVAGSESGLAAEALGAAEVPVQAESVMAEPDAEPV
jgi:hypothetical protein